jgi:hypothetical protein
VLVVCLNSLAWAEQLPSRREVWRQCLSDGTALIKQLQPHAQQIQVKPLKIVLPQTISLVSLGTESADRLARYIWTTGEIDLFSGFCKLDMAGRRAVIAHELGHAVDAAVLDGHVMTGLQPEWERRPAEIAATTYALAIYRRAGLPERELEAQLPASQLAVARNRLQPVK